MKLLYLYVDQHRCLQGLSVNFTAEYRFRTSIDGMPHGTVAIYCDVNHNAALPSDFWSWRSIDKDSGRDRGVVEDVTAIVGENGSGKTSIASTFYNISNPIEDWQGRTPHYICIYKKAGKFICMHGQNWTLNVDSLPVEIRTKLESKICSQQALPFDFVYYSPYTTTESVIQSYQDSIVDVSTGSILRHVSDSDQTVKGALFSEVAFLDYSKIFRFIYACRNGDNALPKEMPMPLPVSVELHVNDSFANALESKLSEFETQRHYILASLGVSRFAKAALRVFKCKCFFARSVGAFLCSVVINDFEKIAGLDEKGLEEYCFVERIASCVTKYVNMLNLREDISAIEDEHCAKKRIADCLREMVGNVIEVVRNDDSFSLYCKNSSIVRDEVEVILRCLSEWYAKKYEGHMDLHFEYEEPPIFFVKNEVELDWISSFATHLHQVGRCNHFLKFSFPKMSSGEMAYLTMFGRLYSVFSGQVDGEYGETASDQKDVLLYLDEAETTLHPQWQRYLVLYIIWFLSRFANGKSVHVVFASHSPVLLSDVPRSNAIFLKKSPRVDFPSVVESACDIEINTFGNNIFDLYRYVFTRDKGAVGAFADTKLTMALKEVSRVVKSNSKGGKRKLSKKAETILSLVGDCGIARYLEDLKAGGLV